MTITQLLVLSALSTLGVFGAAPVGSISSSDNFQVSGANIAVAGIPSWPVLAGDQIQTGASPAMVRLNDGSRLVVNSNSRISVETAGSATRVKLISGSLKYTAGKENLLEVVANKVSSRTSAFSSGTVWTDGSTGFIAAASPLAGATFVPTPIFRPGPLNLPGPSFLNGGSNPPQVGNPGAGSLVPWLSARP